MHNASHACALCCLPVRNTHHSADFSDKTLHFCCSGCMMVYTMLMEASDVPDPAGFKESELYRRCVAAGVVPATEADLISADSDNRKLPFTPDAALTSVDILTVQHRVDGMWCPACAWVIQSALENVEGVQTAACDFATDRLRCHYDPTRVDPESIADTIRDLGYIPLPVDGSGRSTLWRREFVRLVICALLSANVMMLSWALYSGFFTALTSQDIRYISLPIMVMATVVLFYGGGPLFRKAWWGMRALAPGMEALVCLGAGSAYLYSLVNFFSGSWHLYFDTASMLITLVLLGKLLEAKAKARVRHDLEGFLALQPNKVRLCSRQFPQGRFVALGQLAEGDHFRVQINEMVPADGRIIVGHGLVDESAVTGESRPQAVGPGDGLTSGTCVIKGDVTAKALQVGEASLIGQMITIIEASLARRTPLESRTDRWLAMFVPLMIGLALGTALVGHGLGLAWDTAFERGLTVMVIACPCALGIAIPLARIGGMSEAGRHGLLVRDFEAFERARTIDCVVMDKTGTLTRGDWSLSQVATHGQMDADKALALAAGLEKDVDHAVARAIMSQARNQKITPEAIEKIHVHDNGVTGTDMEGRSVKIGSWDFATTDKLFRNDVPLSTEPLSQVYLSLDQEVCATFAFGDEVRATADGLIQQLQKDGFELHLISGDAQMTTQAVAQRIGITHAMGGLLPREKAEYISRLKAGGHIVVMMGDGINDAPALAGADLSVALHRDASLAQQAASVTLMQGDPAQLTEFLSLAKQVNLKVGQNLGCAWIYNLISIPIAMSGLLNPLVAVTAMLLSSLTVIGNTLLLVRQK